MAAKKPGSSAAKKQNTPPTPAENTAPDPAPVQVDAASAAPPSPPLKKSECAMCGRPQGSCPMNSCPSGVLADPLFNVSPPWLRKFTTNLVKMLQDRNETDAVAGQVKVPYIPKATHDLEVAALKQRIATLEARPPLRVVDGSRFGSEGQEPESVDAPVDASPAPAEPPPRTTSRACACGGVLGRSCPLCHGSGSIEVVT